MCGTRAPKVRIQPSRAAQPANKLETFVVMPTRVMLPLASQNSFTACISVAATKGPLRFSSACPVSSMSGGSGGKSRFKAPRWSIFRVGFSAPRPQRLWPIDSVSVLQLRLLDARRGLTQRISSDFLSCYLISIRVDQCSVILCCVFSALLTLDSGCCANSTLSSLRP